MRKFLEIIGHIKQISMLQKDIEADNLSHAYIFSGPSNIGKTLLIKAFSKSILCDCEDSVGCKYCKNVEENVSADFMQNLDDGELIKVEMIREFIDKLSMSASGKAKIMFIENIERMNVQAANAFLKILEEAPKETHILMTCSDSGRLLPTISSRARIIRLMPPGKVETLDFLKKSFPNESDETIFDAYELALERLGKAYGFLKNPESFAEYKDFEEKLSKLITEQSIVERFLFVEKMLSDKDLAKKKIKIFYEIMTFIMRKRLLDGNFEKKEQVLKILSKISGDGILLKRNINARLLIENLMLIIQ